MIPRLPFLACLFHGNPPRVAPQHRCRSIGPYRRRGLASRRIPDAFNSNLINELYHLDVDACGGWREQSHPVDNCSRSLNSCSMRRRRMQPREAALRHRVATDVEQNPRLKHNISLNMKDFYLSCQLSDCFAPVIFSNVIT